MKKILTTTIVILFSCITINAVDFTHKLDNVKRSEKELRKFYEKCTVYTWNGRMSITDKKFMKLQDTYKQLIEKYPDSRFLTMSYYGVLNITRDCSLANKEEGFKMIVEALPHISDTLPELKARLYANIGNCYLDGTGTEKNDKLAFSYYQKAFGLDSAYAENMAYLYLTGTGTAVDRNQAFSLLQDCYNFSVSNFVSNVWEIRNKYNYTDDYEKLYSILILNRESFDTAAIENYIDGIRYFHIYKDYDKAEDCLEKAANHNMPNAMYELALLYNKLRTYGIEKKESKESYVKWLEKSAGMGYHPAVFEQGLKNLRRSYNSTFVAQENKARADAYPYFKQLADVGYGPAKLQLFNYERYGWAKEANLFGDIAKGILSVSAMATSIKNDGWALGLSSQMHNTGKQYGDIRTVDDFLGAMQLQNMQLEAKKRGQNPENSSPEVDDNDQITSADDESLEDSSTSSGSYSSSSSRSTNNTKKSSNTNKTASSNGNKTEAGTKNCPKCGVSGKVACSRCKGSGRTKCAGCDGKGYITVLGTNGKRKCTICDGKATTRCLHCNGNGKEKCLYCNGKGQVRK